MTAAVDRVEELLRLAAGMQLDGPGRARLQRVLVAMAAERGEDPRALSDRLGPGSPELRTVAERITVQETRFFRDEATWQTIRADLLPALLSVPRSGPFVVWSAGAAHGQEAYSLAISLEEAGCNDFRIVASDINRDAIGRIEDGVYHERELRGLDVPRRERWLVRLPDGRYRVRPELRSRVVPVAHNIVEEAPPVEPAHCALVLCRYTLIYLTPDAADRLLERIAGLLRPDGRLVIGAAESLWHLTERFEVVDRAGPFTYRARGPESRRPAAPAPGSRSDVAPSAPGRGARPRPERPRPGAPARTRETPERRGPAARRADAARPGAARPAPGLPASAPGAPAGSLRPEPPERPSPPAPARAQDAAALVADGERAVARGDLDEATRAFRGAAYLEPSNPIAHLQLGLVLERRGDRGAGRAFRAAWTALGRTDPASLRSAIGDYRAEELVHLLAAKLEEHR